MNVLDYELQFRSLHSGCAFLCLPCDAKGHADMNVMSRATLNSYLYARALVGLDFSMSLAPLHSQGVIQRRSVV